MARFSFSKWPFPAAQPIHQRPSIRWKYSRSVSALALIAAAVPTLAHAVDLPPPISFEAGPLGTLQLSGGADGYVYALTGAGSGSEPGLLGTSKSGGIQFLNGLIQLQKPDGLVRFTIEAGATNALTLGTKPGSPSIQTYSTGPLRNVYVTLAPIPNLTISAGQVASLEGYESGVEWKNFNMLLTSLWYVQNSQNVGVTATYTYGPVSGTVTFGDGFDTNVWNYIQFSRFICHKRQQQCDVVWSYQSRMTGLGARFYGSATTAHNLDHGGIGRCRKPRQFICYRRLLQLHHGQFYCGTGGAVCVVDEESQGWIDGLLE